jgi:hypothetical protein
VLHGLATSRRRNAPPLVGFVCLSEFYQQRRCRTDWVSVKPPMSSFVVICMHEAYRRNRLWGIHTAAFPHILRFEEILSQALAPLQSITYAPPRANRPACTDPGVRPSRGFSPFSVFPAMRSHIDPVIPKPSGYVASSGFLTPSTLCSPHDLPSLFHPGPAHGIFPSRP